MSVKRSAINYIAFLAVLSLAPAIISQTSAAWLITPHFWLIFLFLSLLTFMVVCSILVVQQKNEEMYAQAFLAGTVVKILACLFFALIFIHKFELNRLVFTANFFYVYLLNTAFEVYCLLFNLRNQNLR